MRALAPTFSTIPLPRLLRRRIEDATRLLLSAPGNPVDFSEPRLEAGLAGPDSESWRIFKNPVTLFVGGVAAVILELAHPAVRAGVWDHSTFRSDPVGRLRRTGLAAMITVYGARSIAEPMIARVVRMHGRIAGVTSGGVPYAASDTQLLDWVHATAAFGFASAYHRYAARLTEAEFDAFYGEGVTASRLYGALGAPRCSAGLQSLFRESLQRLEPSPVVMQFLEIMRVAPAFPPPLQWLQHALVRAAVDLIPPTIRHRLGLTEQYGLGRRDRLIVRVAATLADRIVVEGSPAAASCIRMGLPANYLYG